ncbi:MAG: hypothetical protein JXR83_23335 [Deltaproteobacteria bacterium]|nr:hypothetical protein [Deltaproteobacteria bacterium]
MENNILDNVTERLTEMIVQRAAFEAKYGKQASHFLDNLPGLFRLFHRLTFDLEVGVEMRRLAAAVAIYIAEPHDYCGEASRGIAGLIDDIWLAYRALALMLERVPAADLQRHWLVREPFDHIVDLAHNVGAIESQVPSRVLTLLKQFLDLPTE